VPRSVLVRFGGSSRSFHCPGISSSPKSESFPKTLSKRSFVVMTVVDINVSVSSKIITITVAAHSFLYAVIKPLPLQALQVQ